MKSLMKQCLGVGIASLFCVPGAAFAHDHGRSHECSLETLDGLYVFNANGFSLINGVWQPKAIVEYIRFNGDGTLSVPAATVANRGGDGAVTQSPPGGMGTYTLGEDCKGTLQFIPGPAFDIFASPRALQFEIIQTNPNNILQGAVRKLSR